eukprot:gene7267-biopygen3034
MIAPITKVKVCNGPNCKKDGKHIREKRLRTSPGRIKFSNAVLGYDLAFFGRVQSFAAGTWRGGRVRSRFSPEGVPVEGSGVPGRELTRRVRHTAPPPRGWRNRRCRCRRRVADILSG